MLRWLLELSLTLPQKVNKPEYLERIYGLILTRISGMYSRLFIRISAIPERNLKAKLNKKFYKDVPDFVYKEMSNVFEKTYGADDDPGEPSETFRFFDLENEFDEVFRADLI